jgi:hypothetical protein
MLSLGAQMELDVDKIDQAALALLALGRHEGYRAWKAFDWEVMGRLHRSHRVRNPGSKARSLIHCENRRHPSQ